MTALPDVLSDPIENGWLYRRDFAETKKAIDAAVGAELRAVREHLGWSRRELVEMVPFRLSEKVLGSYEKGGVIGSLTRLVELCLALGASPGVLLDMALQNAKVALETVVVRVDLLRLINTDAPERLVRWARHRLAATPDGMAALHPLAMRELAAACGYDHEDLASRLAAFGPDRAVVAQPEREPASPPARRSVPPPAGPARASSRPWSEVVAAMAFAEDADERLVGIYHTLHPNQQFTLKALAYGTTAPTIAHQLGMSNFQMSKHTAALCRRFGEGSPVGLTAVGRELFAELPESVEPAGNRVRGEPVSAAVSEPTIATITPGTV